MTKELTVVLKDTERTYRQKFLVYENISLSSQDPVISNCIDEALKNFEGEPEDVQVKILMVVK